jgi:hypothetical protein
MVGGDHKGIEIGPSITVSYRAELAVALVDYRE